MKSLEKATADYEKAKEKMEASKARYEADLKRFKAAEIAKTEAENLEIVRIIRAMDMTDLKEILRLLQISGNNLNQYAKKANETGSIYCEDIEEVKNSQKEILQEMRKVLDKLTALI